MKIISTTAFLFAILTGAFSQTPEAFAIEIEPLTIAQAPGIHSYSWGKTTDGKWIILGGRIDGLHQRQPNAAFLEQDNNKFAFVIDPLTEQVWSTSISVLSASLFEQLQSTNQEFVQRDTMLYIFGGYGYSATALDHITFPNLTAISVDGLANAIINNEDITSFFRQITDSRFKITGGQVGIINDEFYLAGGHLFDGRYNPQAPDHGPGYFQEYANKISIFNLDDDGTNLTVNNYSAQTDTVNLHRRDYNMAPQIFPDGTHGFTMFSGVFNYTDMPYLNSVDIKGTAYQTNNNFTQYLSQYHSAKLPIRDNTANAMHTIFFGGMSQYTLDSQDNLVEDINVPFVKTISKVTRFADGSMEEKDLKYVEMPVLVGAGAEFIPTSSYYMDDMLDISAVPQTKTLVGYVYGGIESSAANIFFTNDGTQSSASNVIFKVYINKATADIEEVVISDKKILNISAYPNPAEDEIFVNFMSTEYRAYNFSIVDIQGKVVNSKTLTTTSIGKQELSFDISSLAAGVYNIVIDDKIHQSETKFIKK